MNLYTDLIKTAKLVQEQMKRYYNTRRSKGSDLKEGDKVQLLYKNFKSRRPSKKLDYIKLEPFITVLGQRHLPYSVDPNSYQPIRIFHPRDRKSPLARLLLAPWQPLYILPVSNRLLLLLSLIFLYSSNLQALVQKHLYKPIILY